MCSLNDFSADGPAVRHACLLASLQYNSQIKKSRQGEKKYSCKKTQLFIAVYHPFACQ